MHVFYTGECGYSKPKPHHLTIVGPSRPCGKLKPSKFGGLDQAQVMLDYFNGKGAFASFGLTDMKENYAWRIGKVFREHYPGLPKGNGHSANVALKAELHCSWHDPSLDRLALTRLIIADWGGIRRNSDETLIRHRDLAKDPPSELPIAGVASYSKVLSIVAPDSYAIFDARVAVALRAILIIAKPETASVFPYLPSRNERIQQFMAKYHAMPEGHWNQIPKPAAYNAYLALLRAAQQKLPSAQLYDLEMCLFSQAERLIGAAG